MEQDKARKDFTPAAQKPASPFNIFLDIDGVIGDFDRHAKEQGKLDEKGAVKYDALDLAWWKSMPAFDGAADFYRQLKAAAPVKFLTAPTMSTDCISGKAEWVQAFLPESGKFALMDLIICPKAAKQFLAGPRNILIDDSEKNIEQWVAAGGIGIHHAGDFSATLARLREIVEAPPPARLIAFGRDLPKGGL